MTSKAILSNDEWFDQWRQRRMPFHVFLMVLLAIWVIAITVITIDVDRENKKTTPLDSTRAHPASHISRGGFYFKKVPTSVHEISLYYEVIYFSA
jgi:hypothetical protein